MSRFRFSDDDLVPALIFIVLAALACVTPAQNDTWWHLRSGQQMWQTGAFLVTEPFSHTAYGAPLNNHWWLSQLAFYGAHALGGPLLLTLLAGACALAAVAGSWLLIRGPWELRTGLLAWLVVVTVPEWSIRPQVISLALLVLMAHLVERNRLAWLPLICVVWANAHAMVVFGVVMGGAVLLEALLWSRDDVKRAAAVAAGCALAPVISPPGFSYWPQVLATVSVSRELQIQEYQMPLRLADLPFWAGAAALVAVAFLQRHRLRSFARSDRILLVSAGVLAVAAATAGRNIAFFAVSRGAGDFALLAGSCDGSPPLHQTGGGWRLGRRPDHRRRRDHFRGCRLAGQRRRTRLAPDVAGDRRGRSPVPRPALQPDGGRRLPDVDPARAPGVRGQPDGGLSPGATARQPPGGPAR